MERNFQEDENFKAAKKRVKDIKGFYIHLIVYLFVNIALLVADNNLTQLKDNGVKISNFYTPIFWGVGLAAHWISVFGPGFFLGNKWEEKKIKEIMEKDRKRMEKWE